LAWGEPFRQQFEVADEDGGDTDADENPPHDGHRQIRRKAHYHRSDTGQNQENGDGFSRAP